MLILIYLIFQLKEKENVTAIVSMNEDYELKLFSYDKEVNIFIILFIYLVFISVYSANSNLFLCVCVYIRVVLILGIFKFLRGQGLIWFEINKKKNIPQVSSFYVNFNPCLTAMQVSHLNNMGFLALGKKMLTRNTSRPD